jgi:hypothetical protein
MATRPPKRRLTPQQQYNRGLLPQQTSVGDTRAVFGVRAAPRAASTFRPTQVKMPTYGTPAGGNQRYWSQQPGYRTQSEKYPNAPGMPVEYNPNADTGTVQGAIDAGLLPWNKGLGGLGYKPPPRAPTQIGIAGYSPDLWGAVGSDPELAAYRNAIGAANAADEASARENINALAVGWGGDLSDMVKQGLIDQKAADAAKANQFSQMAELQRQLDVGRGQLQSQLAARGILSSGALPGGEAEINRQFQKETTTGLQDLIGQIRNIRSQQAQAAAERQSGISTVMGNVASRLSQMEQYQPIPDMQAQWDPSVGAYVDDWGRRFDRQGNRLS